MLGHGIKQHRVNSEDRRVEIIYQSDGHVLVNSKSLVAYCCDPEGRLPLSPPSGQLDN
jgi:hypothetical protein